jgi:4-hydroxyphenylpyruvate dioxygenase
MPHLALNTATLTGTLEAKLRAATLAGFDGVGVWESDLRSYPGGSPAAAGLISTQALAVPEVFTLRDWQFRSEADSSATLERARCFFEFLGDHGYETAIVVGATQAGSLDVAVAQLRELCDLAQPHGVRLAYELFAWGQSFSRMRDAWEMVCRTERDNLGIVLDTFHFCLAGSTLQELDAVPVDRIAIVHLADAPASELDVITLCRHHRVFPGQGMLPLREIVSALEARAYAGWYCLELFNDEYSRRDPTWVAREGIAAVRQLFHTEK